MSGNVPQAAEFERARGELDAIARTAGQISTAHATGPVDAGAVSFGFFGGAGQSCAEIAASVQSLLAKLKPTTVVATTQDGTGAQTVLNAAGNAVSVWSNVAPAGLIREHFDAVDRTLAFRTAVIAAAASAAGALAATAAAVANPLTALSALQSIGALRQALDRLVSSASASSGG